MNARPVGQRERQLRSLQLVEEVGGAQHEARRERKAQVARVVQVLRPAPLGVTHDVRALTTYEPKAARSTRAGGGGSGGGTCCEGVVFGFYLCYLVYRLPFGDMNQV